VTGFACEIGCTITIPQVKVDAVGGTHGDGPGGQVGVALEEVSYPVSHIMIPDVLSRALTDKSKHSHPIGQILLVEPHHPHLLV
jgi:hypothetical protein